MGATRTTEAARLEALRRRLYAPDVTAEEVAAYRAAAERQGVAEAPAHPGGTGEPPTGPAPPSRTAPGLRVAIAGGVAVLAAAAIAVLVTAHPLAAITSASVPPTPVSSASLLLVQNEVPTSVATRTRFIAALRSGQEPGILEYLFEHPADVPGAISTTRRAASTEYAGQGTSTIALDPSDLAQAGGRVTVMLVVDRPATYSWRAERIAQRNDRSGPVIELAELAGRDLAGQPTSATFHYDGRAPTRLAVYTDETVKWGAVVVFTD